VSGGPYARIKASFFLTIRLALSGALAQLTAVFVGLLVFFGDIDARLQANYLKANAPLFVAATALVDGGIQRGTDAVKVQTDRVNALSTQVGSLRQNEIDPLTSDPQIQQRQQEINRLLDQQSKADEAVTAAENFAAFELGGIKGTPTNSG